MSDSPDLPPIPFHVDQLVKLVEHTSFAGRDDYGRIGRVAAVNDFRAACPEYPDDESVVIDVSILVGRDLRGQVVWDTQLTPFWLNVLQPLLEPPGDWVCGGRVMQADEWPAATSGVPA